MELKVAIIAAILATSSMTLFTYLVSRFNKELYSEPVLLNYMLAIPEERTSNLAKRAVGWVFNYVIGFLLVTVFHCIWYLELLRLSVAHGLLLGALTGIIGIYGWKLMFSIAQFHPKINLRTFYLQLFIAHIIFTMVVVGVYLYYRVDTMI